MEKKVNNTEKKKGMDKRASWMIGGTTMIGIGVGFFLLPIHGVFFVASTMLGIGVGLVLAPIISRGNG
jgi:hypothetical protein